jgi:hypothetical protein
MTMNNQTHPLFDPRTDCLTEQAMFDYIDEKLSPKDAHAVEKHMLDCALCSEAMEGLQMVKDRSKIHAAVMPGNSLKGKNTKGGGGKLIPLNYNIRLAAAAVLVLLLGCFILFRFILNENQNNQTATIERPLQMPSPTETSTPQASVSDEQTYYRYFKPANPRNLRQSAIVSDADDVKAEVKMNEKEQISIYAIPAGNSSSEAGSPVSPQPVASAPADASKEMNVRSSNSLVDKEVSALAKDNVDGDESRVAANSVSSENSKPVTSGQTTDAAYMTQETVPSKTRGLKKEKQHTGNQGGSVASPPSRVQPSLAYSSSPKKEDAAMPDKKPTSPDISSQNNSIVSPAAGITSSANNSANTNSKPLLPAASKQVTTIHETPQINGDKNKAPSHKTAAKRRNKPADPILQKGMEAYSQKKYSDALPLFQQAQALEPGNESALFYSGVCYLSLIPPNTSMALERLDAILNRPASEFTSGAKWYKALCLIKSSDKEPAKILLRQLSEGKGEYQKPATELLSELK